MSELVRFICKRPFVREVGLSVFPLLMCFSVVLQLWPSGMMASLANQTSPRSKSHLASTCSQALEKVAWLQELGVRFCRFGFCFFSFFLKDRAKSLSDKQTLVSPLIFRCDTKYSY